MLALLITQNFSPLIFKHGVVVSDNLVASEVGRDVMKKGGNAVDAAVATAFALAVVHPEAGNLGGGGFMMVRLSNGQTIAIDYREKAPLAATKDMYVAKPNDSTIGYRAAGVPGTPAGLELAHKKFGHLAWREVVEPARRIAAEGFLLSHARANSLTRNLSLFKRFPSSLAVFGNQGRGFTAGDLFRQPDLARTLSRIRDSGARDFYKGETAKLIAKDMKVNGGLITEADLDQYQPAIRTPLVKTIGDYEFITMPAPSSGGIALLQMLGTVDGKLEKFGSSATVHVSVEAMKRAFADRAAFLGDPDFVKVPTNDLLDPARIEAFRQAITDKATPSDRIKPQLAGPREGDHTTHFTVIDAEGTTVTTTTTLNTSYGSGATVTGAGFLLNNEMDDFTSAPGRPNAFGLIQGEANAIAPGKRPLSSMTPTIVLKAGKLFLALGSPGGPTIINTVFQTIENVITHKMDIQRAVAAPRFHHQWKPDVIDYEPFGLSTDVIDALKAKGHKVSTIPRTMGSCHAIMVLPDGWRSAGVDPRLSDAGAAGW